MLTYLALLCCCLALCYGQTCPSPTQYYNVSGTCIECPVTGLDPKCASAQCSDPTNTTCYSCRAGYQLGADKKCNAICAIAGTYYDTTSMSCLNCPAPTNCQTPACDDPSSVTCVVCNDGFLMDATGSCTGTCPSIDNCATPRCTNVTNICIICSFPWSLDSKMTCTSGGPANCTASQYLNNGTNVCVDCSLPNNCASGAQRCSVDDPNTVTCTSCATGFQLDGTGTCVATNCASNQYLDIGTNKCTDCTLPANCMNQTCQSATQITCLACTTGYVLGIDGTCALPSNCDSDQFLDSSTNLCVACPFPSMCSTGTCTSTTSVTCTVCVSNYVLIANACQQIAVCGPTQYLDAVNNVCIECTPSPNCFSYSCTTASDTSCAVCNTGYFLDPASGDCTTRSSCNATQYLDPTSDACIDCPFLPYGSCSVGVCTSSLDATCMVCNSGYTLLSSGQCQPVISGTTPCNLCPSSGQSTGCPAGALCCGCATTGTGYCALSCTDNCIDLICPSETTCGTPAGCQTRGGCQVITTGTCATCFVGFEGVPDGNVGLYMNCQPIGYRTCDSCNPDVSACSDGDVCCCGTCRSTCDITCAAADCTNLVQQSATVVTEHHVVGTNCEDNNDLDVIKDMIRAHVAYILGAWLQGTGTVQYTFNCNDGSKRQSTCTLATEIDISGINADYQAEILQQNFITNGTGNGVSATLDFAEISGGGGGLSGGAIAGIVIGAIVGFILVIVIVYVVVTKQGGNVESV